MRISDWSSDVCSSDLDVVEDELVGALVRIAERMLNDVADIAVIPKADALDDAAVPNVETGYDPMRGHDGSPPRGRCAAPRAPFPRSRPKCPRCAAAPDPHRSDEHTSDLQSLMRTSYA